MMISRHDDDKLYSFRPDKQEELQHDLGSAASSIEDWKSHILHSIYQDAAKSEFIDNLKPTQVLLIMDWAMKFIPTSFRQTQHNKGFSYLEKLIQDGFSENLKNDLA